MSAPSSSSSAGGGGGGGSYAPVPTSSEASDREYARQLLEQDHLEASQRAAIINAQRNAANAAVTAERERQWAERDQYYYGGPRYYYGTWRSPPVHRNVVVYRDHADEYFLCFFLFLFIFIIFFVGIILIIYYTVGTDDDADRRRRLLDHFVTFSLDLPSFLEINKE